MTKTLRIALMTAAAVGLSGGALAQERGEYHEEAQDLMNPSEAYEAEAGPSGNPLSPIPDTTGEPMAVRVTPTGDAAASADRAASAPAAGADGLALRDGATDWSGVTEPRPANDPPRAQRMAADDGIARDAAGAPNEELEGTPGRTAPTREGGVGAFTDAGDPDVALDEDAVIEPGDDTTAGAAATGARATGATGAAVTGATGSAGAAAVDANRVDPGDSAVGAQSPGSRADFGLDNAGVEAAQDADAAADRRAGAAAATDRGVNVRDPLDGTAAAAGGATAGGDNPDLGTYDQEGAVGSDASGLEANRPDPLDDDEVNLGAGAAGSDLGNVDTSDGVTPIEERQINRAAGQPGVPARNEGPEFPERAGVPGPGGLSGGTSTATPPSGGG